jgi:nicotinamidase-related amidase
MLVVIDMQQVFGAPDSPWFAPRFAQTLDPISRLVAAYEPDVVWTRFVAPAEPEGAWIDYYREWPFALQPPDAPLYALVDRFARRPTVDLPTFGKWGAALAASVEDSVEDGIVVAGVSSDCCVLSTVLAAADAGERVRVAADACAGASDETHDQALALMRLYAPLVEVTTSAALLDGSG